VAKSKSVSIYFLRYLLHKYYKISFKMTIYYSIFVFFLFLAFLHPFLSFFHVFMQYLTF